MAAKNLTRNNTQHQAGALAALEALRKADKAIELQENADMSLADSFAYSDAVIANMVKASGVTDPHTAGFIACLAEMACSTLAGAIPDPEHWKPDTAMAPAELKAKRQQAIYFADEFTSGALPTARAIHHFGGIDALAAALKVSKRTIQSWGSFPPQPRQYQIEILTHGELRAKRERAEA